ncbi:MAG TPA: TraX family protein [Lachnospiraceae bacterium]|nr:TraX family protein [Lachnospiraceae bacterium]
MSTFTLKIIAILAMLIDHISAIFINDNTPLFWITRGIGRIAFPIFCFLIVEGYYRTSDVKKYLLRLGVFALISEVPFDLCFYGTPFNIGHQNVFFTLFLGLCTIYGIDKVKKKYKGQQMTELMGTFAVAMVAMFASQLLFTDYNIYGILLILCFYMMRGQKIVLAIAIVAITVIMSHPIQYVAVVAFVPIFLFNGRKGPNVKYLFYAFYPVHLLILYLIQILIK